MKRSLDPKSLSAADRHQYIVGAVAPRPIAFVSTVDSEGNYNLAPYSFFNAFSSNPPIVVFSSNRRVRDNTTKDTLENVMQAKELVINMVNYNIVRQMSLSSVEFPKGVSEFTKTGLTPVPADLVNAPMVGESPINMECKVNDIITLGESGGAGHLIICEVLKMHIEEEVLGENDRIDPHKIDLMGRMGRSYYVRASGDAIHTIYQNVQEQPIGYDKLPDHIKNSKVLTGNELAALAALTEWPDETLIEEMQKTGYESIEDFASKLIAEGKALKALALLI